MKEKELLSNKSLRKLDALFLHNNVLFKEKDLQKQIIAWAEETIDEAREEWKRERKNSVGVIMKLERRAEAVKRGKIRDRRYFPFREYFKSLQKEEFKKCKKAGKKLIACQFVEGFLSNRLNDIEIPYKKSNRHHQLLKLARENNREFKKIA